MLPENPILIQGGIIKKALIYMVDCFPKDVPMDRVYHDHVIALAKRLKTEGVTDIIFDIEYVTSRPESIVWQFGTVTNRATAIPLWKEFISVFRSEYRGNKVKIGMYGNHAGWVDYHAFALTRGPENSATLLKYEFFDTWEKEMIPLVEMLDFVHPSVYGQWHNFLNESQTWLAYGIEMTIEQYKDIQAKCYQSIYDAICKYHPDKSDKIRWFITPSYWPTGTQYPDWLMDWQLNQLRKYKNPVCVWTGPEPKGRLTDTQIGIMLGYHDGRRY